MVMKTLQQIKDEYAQGIGHIDWIDFLIDNGDCTKNVALDEIATRYAREVAREALKNASENALLDWQYLPYEGESPFIDKQSILDEKNIPI